MSLPKAESQKSIPWEIFNCRKWGAYWDGIDVSGNPYDEDTEERQAWEEGWRAAKTRLR